SARGSGKILIYALPQSEFARLVPNADWLRPDCCPKSMRTPGTIGLVEARTSCCPSAEVRQAASAARAPARRVQRALSRRTRQVIRHRIALMALLRRGQPVRPRAVTCFPRLAKAGCRA